MSQIVVLDRSDGVVARIGKGGRRFVRACRRCDLLVEHVRLTNEDGSYRYVAAAAHRCA